MKQFHYLPSDDDTTRAVFSLLGEDRVLLCIAPDGHIIWQTDAAERMLRLEPMSQIGQALSETADRAVTRALRDGAWLDMKEEIEEEPWRLRTWPVRDGMLLLLEPCVPRPAVSNVEAVRSRQQAQTIGAILQTAKSALDQAQDEASRELWERMLKLARRATRTHIHGEIAEGKPYLDDFLEMVDLAALCEEAAEETADASGIPVEVLGEPIKLVASIQELQCIILNLLTNAVARRPQKITIELRRAVGRVHLAVYHNGSRPENGAEQLLGGWRGAAEARSDRELAEMGLGLPTVQVLLGQRGGSLFEKADDDREGFIAVLPDDLTEDPETLRQCGVSSGIDDLIGIELSVL